MTVRALVIAVEEYPHAQGIATKLAGTHAAAERFIAWLSARKQAEVYYCAGTDRPGQTGGTRKDEILQQAWALVEAGRDRTNELYVFFSGHGFQESSGPARTDILLGSEFIASQVSGGACIRLAELQEKLQYALGPCDHYYFIDACRNLMPAEAIESTNLGIQFNKSKLGIRSRSTLLSTAPAEVAAVRSGFPDYLVSGLGGAGRAKSWAQNKWIVTFDGLQRYIRNKLTQQAADTETKGTNDGYIVEVSPTPTSPCTITVLNAQQTDAFVLRVRINAGVAKPVVAQHKFTGPELELELDPGDYELELEHAVKKVIQRVPPPGLSVDAYDACVATFELRDAQLEQYTQPTASFDLEKRGIPVQEIEQVDLGKLKVKKVSIDVADRDESDDSESDDGAFDKTLLDEEADPGSPADMLESEPTQEANDALFRELGMPTGTVLDDQTASMMLSLIGAEHIMRLHSLPESVVKLALHDLSGVRQDGAVGYVLAFLPKSVVEVRVALGDGPRPQWRSLRLNQRLEGLWEGALTTTPGRALFSFQLFVADERGTVRPRQPVTLVTHSFANRATLFTLADSLVQGGELHQYFLPLGHLETQLDPTVQRYLYEQRDRIPVLWQVQHDFKHKLAVEKSLRGPKFYWYDALFGKWLDPTMALLAAYELLRRREHMGDSQDLLQTAVDNLRRYFSGLADVELIAQQAGLPCTPPTHAPLILDGLLAMDDNQEVTVLPLSPDKLTFEGPWVVWKNAVVPSRERVAEATIELALA